MSIEIKTPKQKSEPEPEPKPAEPEPVKEPEPEPVKEPEPVIEIKEEIKEEPIAKKVMTKSQLQNIYRAKIEEITALMPNEHTREIFRDSASNYDFNDTVENNINRLMRRAQDRIIKNEDVIKEKKLKLEQKAIEDEQQKKELEKKNRMERMRAKYNRMLVKN